MVCDICHERVYDYEAIEILQKLLWSHLTQFKPRYL